MAFSEHRFSFAGKKIRDYEGGALLNLDHTGLRIRTDFEEPQAWFDKFNQLLAQPNVDELTTFVVGQWGDEHDRGPEAILEALVASRDKLPNLTAFFIGDITYEECEISWIHQGDLSPLLSAYPNLEFFGVRGSEGLSLGNLKHDHLRHLIIQSGGLDVRVVREVLGAELPSLEHLDLYLGTENYGANTQVEDLAPLLRGELFPKLAYLGLRNWDRADELAGVLANAPVLERIKELDLSLGTLGDDGVRALMTSPYLAGLEKLDIHHHFVGPEVLNELKTMLRKLKVKIDASEPQDPDDEWRFVEHGE